VLYRIETPSGGIHESPRSADYTHMRCLYCGKELALLKRLTGGGEFCSDAHKQSYQEEYNRLALSRLLQAQKKGQQASSLPAQKSAPPPQASVAVAEPAPEPAAEEVPTPAEPAPVLEEATSEVAQEESAAEAVIDTEAAVSAAPEPLEMAGFLLESPTVTAPLLDETPYQEAWLELAAGPAMSEWQLQNGAVLSLSSADLASLDLRPHACAIEDLAPSLEISPQTLPGTPPDPALLAVANAKKKANTNRLPTSGAIAIDIAPNAAAAVADQSFVEAIGFESTVLFDESPLLDLSATSIDFPAQDSDVVVLAPGHDNGPALAQAVPEREAEDASPRASLEALSRLHQELVEQEAARTEPIEEAPVQVVPTEPVKVAPPPEAVTGENPEVEAPREEIAPEQAQPQEEAAKPKYATELFEVPIRTFPPTKPALIGGDAFPSNTAPLLPHLKSLPLRPKVALANGYVPASNAPAASETKPAPVAAAARTQNPPRPASVVKPAARLAQPKQPAASAKVMQPAAKTSELRTPVSSAKSATAKADTAKPAASQPSPLQESRPTEKGPAAKSAPAADATKPAADATKPAADGTKPAAETTKPSQEQARPAADQAKPAADQAKPAADQTKPAADQTKPAADQTKPAADQTKPAADQAKPKADQAKPKADQTKKDVVPSFGIAQPASASWLGSLKVKLGIAILLLVMASVYFLGWGGKSRQAASSNSAVSTDGSGPSIIMGEGGWVEGWGGDPAGLHAGRQITIYRPSLKLSDYRLEFQASIDVKSIGWVFRASDPNNYYAMKLMMVSTGLSPKVALFKYLVANGKQTQVGRAPVDLPVQQDTVFDVRVDVRGPQFTTYIQGQQVDSWTDDQLKIGGAGFLNEREERGKVKSVSIRYLSAASK
jgi:hypothetical protein